MAIYAIGDVQGCFQSLLALVAQLPLTDADSIWLCGDLVNRGPQSAEVLRWAMAQGDRLVTVLGNHDLHLLASAAGKRRHKKRDTYQDVLEADDRESLLAWLRSRPLVHREAGYLLVHAGLHPSWSIETSCLLARECERAVQQDRWLPAWKQSRRKPPAWSEDLDGDARLASALSVMVGVRTFDAKLRVNTEFAGPPALRPAGCEPWFDLAAHEDTIVFGHWAALGLHLDERHIGLDTGCVWKGALTAVRLEDRAIFTQPALE